MSMNTRLLLITFLCVFSIGQCIAQTWYTGKDNFPQAIFQDSILSHYNYQAEKDIVNVTETDIHPGEGFRPSLSLDIANRNNRENKKYPVYRQNQTGTITKAGYVEKTVWGVVWGYGDSSNFHALLLRAGNPDPYGYHIPELQYSIITVAEGDTIFHAPWNTLSSPYINPETDYNRIHVVPVNGGYEIFIGKERECRIGICHDDRLFGSSAGVYIGSGAKIKMKNWSLSPVEYIERKVFLTADKLYEYLNISTNEIEGFYEPLQSVSASDNIRLGGNYQLAAISTQQHILLLYVNGAQRFQDQWETGMIKAILKPTGLVNIFNVTWFDAEHKPLKDGVKAVILSNHIISIYFDKEGVILKWAQTGNKKEFDTPFHYSMYQDILYNTTLIPSFFISSL